MWFWPIESQGVHRGVMGGKVGRSFQEVRLHSVGQRGALKVLEQGTDSI